MKKILCALLAFGMTFAFVACGGDGGKGGDNSSVDSETSVLSENSSVSSEDSSPSESEASVEDSSEEEFIPDYTSPSELTEFFEGKIGDVIYNTGKHLTITTLHSEGNIYLGGYSEYNDFTVDGGEGFNKILTIMGDGGGVVQTQGGSLTFRNLTIKNESEEFSGSGYREKYAEFGGKIRFENCTIDCSIQLRNDADMEFVNCTINSVATDLYSIWMSDGKVRFENCTFTGYRAIKAYEQPEFGFDVENITVENCIFDSISVKPGLALDLQEEMSTTIVIRGCTFNDCQDWTRDSAEGVDGVYESDVDTKKITFIAENNTVNEVFYETLIPEKE